MNIFFQWKNKLFIIFFVVAPDETKTWNKVWPDLWKRFGFTLKGCSFHQKLAKYAPQSCIDERVSLANTNKKNETPHFNFPQHFSQQVCGPHFMMNNAKSHRHDQSPVALDVTFGQPEKKQIQRFNFHYLRQIYRGENSHTHIACC